MNDTARKSIVIFDCDRTTAESMEDLFYDRRHRWNVEVFHDFAAAKSRVEAEHCDAILAASGQPCRGEELLANARQHNPHAIRFALAEGHRLREMLRSMPVAHQSIPRPCGPTELVRAIERGLEIIDLLGAEQALDILNGDDGLPVVPQIYTELMIKLSQSETDVDDVVDIVARDVALCASILKIANSAYFSLAREIKSVREAVVYLGMRTIQEIVLSQEAFKIFRPRESNTDPVLGSIRQHAAEVAAYGRWILGGPHRDEIFLAGMMHEIGALVALSAAPEVTETVLSSNGRSLAQLSAFVLGLWGMPHTLVQVVAQHREPVDDHDLVAALNLADYYSASRLDSNVRWLGADQPHPRALRRLGYETAEELDARLDRLIEAQVA